jgi:hypothetical protein
MMTNMNKSDGLCKTEIWSITSHLVPLLPELLCDLCGSQFRIAALYVLHQEKCKTCLNKITAQHRHAKYEEFQSYIQPK